jgi:hypothetical protein
MNVFEKTYSPLTNKINDMIKYADPIIDGFSSANRRLGNRIYNIIHDMRDLSISLGNLHDQKKNVELLDDKLDCLRLLLREAMEKEFYHPNRTPPLSTHQWEVWSRANDEIGRLIGGATKTVDNQSRKR